MEGKILVIGDAAIEVEMETAGLPGPGDAAEGRNGRFLPGGPGGNAALAISYFGVEAALCSRVGKDGNGERLRRFFSDCGVGVESLFTEEGAATGLSLALFDGACRGCRKVIFRGAAALLTSGDIDRALNTLPDLVYLSPETESSLAEYAVTAAENKGIPSFLDASSPALFAPLYEKGLRVRALYLQDQVVETYCGLSIRDAGSALKGCLSVGQRLRADYYLLHMRDRGVFLYDGRSYRIVIVSDAAEPRGTGNCPEIESAVLAAEFLKSGDMEEACGFAAVANRLAKSAEGSRIPGRKAAAAYIKSHGLPFAAE